ncbi:MAG: polysaccharide deacetylase family protein [bacterium]|nr:polysaccharide deacetylase family protein [bacterium]
MTKQKRKFKKRVKYILICSVLLVLCFLAIWYLEYNKTVMLKEEEARNLEQLINKINNSYSQYVKVKPGSILYEKVEDKYVEKLKVNKEKEYTLAPIKIDYDTKYFYIEELGYYVRYQDVSKVDSLSLKDTRYKNYLPFNENVVTLDKVNLYQGDELIYELYFSLDTPIIEKDSAGYYIEYNDEEYFIKLDDVLSVYEKENTTLIESRSIPVTVYHFIYLAGDNSCQESICHSEEQIRAHFNYLRENNFFTLNTTELGKFIDGKIRLPEKSVLVSIDDGARAEKFIPLLEEYQVNATLFLISSWYDKEKFASPYMELASHTHNLHTTGVCPLGQGSPLKCGDRASLVNDLKMSREVLDQTKAFCFPFYEYNDYAISVVKEAGFELGFIGGQRKVTKGIDKFKIPRIALNGSTTVEQYARYIN